MRTAAPALALLAACGAPAAPRVCDGAAGARLAVRFDPPGPFAPGEALLYDNGATFLFVAGDCRYGVKVGARWQDVAYGSDTDVDDQTLVDDLALDQLAAHAGTYDGDLATGDTLHVAFGGAAIDCTKGCTGASLPDWLTQLAAHAASLLIDHQSRGEILQGPERVLVVSEAVPATPAFVWPASFAPSTIALAPAAATGTGLGTRVDGADGLALQGLRRDVRDAQFSPAAAYVTTDAAQPPSFAAYLRDALPWEDARGIVADP